MDHRFGNDEKTAVYDENIAIRVSRDFSVNNIYDVHINISISTMDATDSYGRYSTYSVARHYK